LKASFIEILGKYKTSFKISYADSFVLALAEQENATVISTDHHELMWLKAQESYHFIG